MKKLFSILTALCLGFATHAQISTGYIKMELTDVQAEDPQMAQSLAMMKGSIMESYFSENMVRTDMNMMGGFIQTRVYHEVNTHKVYMFNEMMGKKTKVVTTVEEQKKAADKMAQESPKDIKVTYDEKDTKTILGYNCHKAVMTSKGDDQEVKMIFYVTDEIKSHKPGGITPGIPDFELKGTPLEMTIDMGMMKMSYTAKEFKKELPKDAFTMPTSGYEEMSLEDYLKQQAGGGF